ncbi:hypothetical protein V5O48_010161 [Marasmius crinis-equi]|uniref:Uncharacterized protein n=1 Tax=Marasmius crinis-equi TaxID=585013 RepID=A0ABR3F931_9AGAR
MAPPPSLQSIPPSSRYICTPLSSATHFGVPASIFADLEDGTNARIAWPSAEWGSLPLSLKRPDEQAMTATT